MYKHFPLAGIYHWPILWENLQIVRLAESTFFSNIIYQNGARYNINCKLSQKNPRLHILIPRVTPESITKKDTQIKIDKFN